MIHESVKVFFVNKKDTLWRIVPATIVFIILGAGIVYGFVQISTLSEQVASLNSGLAYTNEILANNTSQLSQNITDLNSQTAGLSDTLSGTQKNIDAVKNQVGGVEQVVGTISSTVGSLEKLSKIDPELLKKYSKVYFLNENYTPAHLITIPQEYVYSETRPEEFLSEAWPFLKDLFNTAKAEGVTLYAKSAYRSFAQQQSLKSAYSVIYGAGTANSFSADQGYSEHQLGTTLDFITTGLGGQLTGFDETQPYQWLLDNAYRFGFVLSYPKGNDYYIYEPWHWRFVGVKLATYLYDNNFNFYDVDQRKIDSYLISLFD